jgi:hypothetical protein
MHERVGCVSLAFRWYVLHDGMDGAFDQEASQQIGINTFIGHFPDSDAEQAQRIRLISGRLLDLSHQW